MVTKHDDLIDLQIDSQPAPLASTLQPDGQGTSDASTVRTVSTSASSPAQNIVIETITVMELSCSELQNTIDKAKEERARSNTTARLLRTHVNALQEDTNILASYETDDDDIRSRAMLLVLEARRLRRDIERQAIMLETPESSHETSKEKKPTKTKLTPMKVPVFEGDVTMFRTFKEFFEENILGNDELTSTEKWLRLTESLNGQPAELISEIPRSEHALSVAWKLLLKVYGNEGRPIVELYDRLQKFPVAQNETRALRMAHSKLEGIFLTLERLGHDVKGNSFFKWSYLAKFPVEIAYRIQDQETATLDELRETVDALIQVRERADKNAGLLTTAPVAPATKNPPPLMGERRKPPIAQQANSAQSTQPAQQQAQSRGARMLSCIFCDGKHWNDACTAYTTAAARKQRLTNKCLICLRKAHIGVPCAIQRRCFHCDSMEHNRALCPKKFGAAAEQKMVQAATVQPVAEQKEAVARNKGYFLTFVTQATSASMNEPIQVRVVVDTAGGQSVIRKEIAKKLKLPIIKEAATTYVGLGDVELPSSYRLGEEIQLLPEKGPPVRIEADVINWIIPQVAAPDISRFRAEHPQYEDTYIPPTGEGEPIDILVGSDMLVEILAPEKIITVNKDIALMPTKFGSLILGRERNNDSSERKLPSLLFEAFKNPIHQMCSLDVVGLEGLQSSDIDDEQRAIQNFYDTVQYIEGRYSISWPWRCFPPMLESNFGLALGRLKSLYRRLQHTPELLKEYHAIILQQLEKGIIEIAPSYIKPGAIVHYVPHHPIVQPGKSTVVRPVYDGSSKTSAAKRSLNDNILKGKNWLNHLITTLLRFRRYKNVVISDVAKAFHQISINESDRDAVRFIWLKDPSKPPTENNIQLYRFTRVAFGVVASPFILSATISYHASKQEPNTFLEVILKEMYADNLVAALQDTIDPVAFYNYAKSFFGSMKMDLTKWTTNHAELQQHIPPEDQLPEQIQRVLGLQWNAQLDTITIKPPRPPTEKRITRRSVASQMASYFDPMGWATPIALLAKVFFRKIYTNTDTWDTQLNAEQIEEWMEIASKLKEITSIVLPRQMGKLNDDAQVQLHAFVDASAAAYAVVVYIRITNGDETQLAMVASRNRLTPVKKMTIPKLELIAILLGSRYLAFIREALQLAHQPQTYIWSDSKCALSWMRQDKILPSAVEKHIAEAKTYKITEYRYVPSESNFADVASRGTDFAALQRMRWWDGPEWLYAQDSWPKNELYTPAENISLVFQATLLQKARTIAEDEKKGVAAVQIKEFSTVTALLKRTTTVLKAVTKICKKNPFKNQPEIDMRLAERLWIAWDQAREYALEGEPEAGKEFLLKGMTVFRDEESIIRCQTRIVNSVCDIDTKYPILLVKNSTLTQLIVLHIHEEHYHAGTNHTLANVRQRFWLPHGRRQVYKIIANHCYSCRRHTAQTYPNPPPAPLPEFRITRTQVPFEVTGVDIFGPMTVRVMEKEKWVKKSRWAILFTCATIRAIHIQYITDMTTEEILHGFRRFVARRGVPRKIISDNAAQFHVLDGYFTSLWHTVVKSPTISSYFAQNKIEWEFTIETAAWMGGIYERLVRSVKSALEKTLGSKRLLDRQLETALIEIEAILNARPIAYVDRDPESPIITPNDFLAAKYTAIPVKSEITERDDTTTKLWKSSQAYLDEFWSYWAKNYVLMLRERNDQLHRKRFNAPYQPSKGDVVIMEDINTKRSKWQLAVVERLITGKDGIVRSAQIRINEGTRLIRPVITLAPLGIKMDLPGVHDAQLTKKETR